MEQMPNPDYDLTGTTSDNIFIPQFTDETWVNSTYVQTEWLTLSECQELPIIGSVRVMTTEG